MAAGSDSFRYFILGLLVGRPMSGYDIKQTMKRLSGLLGSPSFGAIYPALHALLEDGLVTVAVEARSDRPPRKTYSLTDDGRRALQMWVAQPDNANGSIRAFVMRLILVGDHDREALTAHLQQRREIVAAHRSALETADGDGEGEGGPGQRLATAYGLATADAELNWLDATLARLSIDPDQDPTGPAT
ncbi:MAG: PadR family transcriptional regulator [Anaerolineae bacterium]|nr:PadR family transcriptional regulator [Anaerolineae bacterium]